MGGTANSIDAKALRRVLGTFVTGVTVITTVNEQGQRYGITANSFSSVSLEPPLVLWSQMLTAPSYPAFRDAAHFGISILSETQVEISNQFAKAHIDKFEGVATFEGLGGVPLIEGATAYLECRSEASYPGGDHAIFLARVERIDHKPMNPLVFASGRYMVAAHHGLRGQSGDLGISSLSHLHGVRLACAAARELAAKLDLTVGVAVWGNMGPTIVDWEESRNPVSLNLRIGMVLPIFGSATGLVLAAFLPERLIADRIAAEREGSTADVKLTQDLLALVRRRGSSQIVAGSAFTELYETEVSAISVPVFDRSGMVVVALTALVHAGQANEALSEQLTATLKEAAGSVSAKLGYAAPA